MNFIYKWIILCVFLNTSPKLDLKPTLEELVYSTATFGFLCLINSQKNNSFINIKTRGIVNTVSSSIDDNDKDEQSFHITGNHLKANDFETKNNSLFYKNKQVNFIDNKAKIKGFNFTKIRGDRGDEYTITNNGSYSQQRKKIHSFGDTERNKLPKPSHLGPGS